MPAALQAKLLHVLQDQQFTRLGNNRPIDIDVRVLAATNQNLENMMRAGTFREDLYYRLQVIELHIPPLRIVAKRFRLWSSSFWASTRGPTVDRLCGPVPRCVRRCSTTSGPATSVSSRT
jgi:transcriptional regulator with GAF, ATPase, and Fis domain